MHTIQARKRFAIITALTAGLGLLALTSVASKADSKPAVSEAQQHQVNVTGTFPSAPSISRCVMDTMTARSACITTKDRLRSSCSVSTRGYPCWVDCRCRSRLQPTEPHSISSGPTVPTSSLPSMHYASSARWLVTSRTASPDQNVQYAAHGCRAHARS